MKKLETKELGWYAKGPPLFKEHYYNNKWLALQQHKNKDIQFYFYEDIFDQFDWKKEINIPFDQLLKFRAQQLRDSYKYIRLWYTGGSDSQTMLNVFIKNNIYIDEIVTVRVGVTDKFDELISETEITKRAIPQLKKLDLPNTKITIVETGPDKVLENLNNQDYFHFVGAIFLRSPVYASSVYKLFPELMFPAHDKYESIANIQGHLKPRICYENNNFYSFYYDTEFTVFTPSPNIECFYSTPNYPEIHIKQCQMLKEYIKNKYPIIKDGTMFSENSKYKHDIEIATRDWVDRSVDLLKGPTGLISNKSKLALKESLKFNKKIYEAFQDKLRYFNKIQPNLIAQKRPIKTKKYCLGP